MKQIKTRMLSALLSLCMIFSMTAVLVVDGTEEAQAGSWGLQGDGWYLLEPECAPGMRLDVSGGSTKSGTNIQIYKANNTDAQRFYLASIGGGYYVITSKVSGKVLDVNGGKKKSGTNVQQWDYNAGSNQAFKIEYAGNGYYYLRPKNNTDLALDVNGAGNKNGTNVQVYNWSRNNRAQRWKLYCLNTKQAYSSVSGIKATDGSKPVTYNVTTNGQASKVTVWACNRALPGGAFGLESHSKLSVRIVSGNKVIVDEVMSGKSHTYNIPKQYKSYTVYISMRRLNGNNILTQTFAGGVNFMNQGRYCQVSLTNATIR